MRRSPQAEQSRLEGYHLRLIIGDDPTAHRQHPDVRERVGPLDHHRRSKRIAPTITHVWLDKGYTGATVAEAAERAGVSVDVVSGPKPVCGFRVQPRHWVVERTNGWINHCRRLDRHYEITLVAHEGFLILSQIALLLRRLDRRQLFDTP
ncbi:transposase [Mycolicibacillus parakoreensis]|uniref:Transposase n=1 Tax=Mycolicibacillus parakoreensis TaxID=1069221 RepID=A0ABY3U2M7_9MYCO|nr:transposase [Mycolicibacillus parakoreensis]ULN53419.1 transposase [Mycolicibacillus parakoreensis]